MSDTNSHDHRPVANQLMDMASSLDNAPRCGSDNDQPEGCRYIRISDTLARIMAQQLRVIAEGL